jgi:phage gp36-like protein
MGTYITKHDILSRIEAAKLVQLTDDARSGQVNDEVVDQAIAEAEGTVERYLRTRYSLPVPLTLGVRSLCLDVAVFQLYQRRATTTGGVYDVVKNAHDKAITFLKDLSAGKAALDVAAAEETVTNPASGDRVLSGPAKEATFSDDKLKGF